jgi:ABC-type sugar transport system substrate-binding protein
MRKFRKRGLAALSLVSAVALLAGCGSDDSSSDTPAATSKSTADRPAGLQAAEALAAKASKPPTKITPTEPHAKPIPSGKKIMMLRCPAQICIETAQALQQGAKVLGWTVKEIEVAPTPQGIQAAFDQAVREKPDGVAQTGYDKVTFNRQLKALEAAGIPVLSTTATDPPGDGIVFQFIGPEVQAEYSRALAAKVVTDAGGKGTIGSVELTGYPTIKGYTAAFNDAVKEFCPDCKIESLTVAPAAIGKSSATEIANWLRAKGDIGHVFLSLDQLASGLKAAVSATGGTMPKLYGKGPAKEGYAALESGERAAAVPGLVPEVSWYMLDAFARLFNKESIDPDKEWLAPVVWSKEANNLPTDELAPQVPDYQEQFKALWNK